MQVPLEWLKQYVTVEASAEDVGTRLTMGGLEVEGIEESSLGPVLDVYITPNRGDCLSLVGVGREVAALYGLPLTVPAPPASEPGGDTAALTSVTIEEPNLCPRYAARIVRGIKVKPSPAWLQMRLEAAGQRPINNVVDVTNYVMLELGQPLHAFDFDKLAENRIVVRLAKEGEALKTLDGEERALLPTMLVIADAEKPIAVAGVMGGADSEVSDTTRNILFESAHFDPLSVRRTSRTLALRTEASYRFERVVDPDGVRRAVDRACELLQSLGQPEAVSGIVDAYPKPPVSRSLTLRVGRAAALLGMPEITPEIAADCLRRLGFGIEAQLEDTLAVKVPSFRPDITQEEDLIEEVGRIYGYENIPETLPIGGTTQGGDSLEGSFISRLKTLLASAGLQEVVTHSLTAPSFFDAREDALRRVPVRNALSAEISGLRRSLIPTLLDTAQHNAAQGQRSLGLFEVGRVWQNEGADGETVPSEYLAVAGLIVGQTQETGWQRDVKMPNADFGTMRGIVESVLNGLGITTATFMPLGDKAEALPQFHPGRAALLHLSGEASEGILGEVHPKHAAKLDFRDRIYVFEISLEALRNAVPTDGVRYQPLARFPSVVRDLAPRVAEAVTYRELETAVLAVNSDLLEAVKITDVFRGAPVPEGIKSVTLSFTFRAAERTLTDADVNGALDKIRTELETRCGATFPA